MGGIGGGGTTGGLLGDCELGRLVVRPAVAEVEEELIDVVVGTEEERAFCFFFRRGGDKLSRSRFSL
jgi:hypothetical protein